MKQYRLKKDLPDYKAGETISKDDDEYYRFDNPLPNGLYSRYSISYVENNPDWFEQVKPKHKLLELLSEKYNTFGAISQTDRPGFSLAMNIVRNYLNENQPQFCEGVKKEYSMGKYISFMLQAYSIQPNAGDSYYVELGKLLDKHLREEK